MFQGTSLDMWNPGEVDVVLKSGRDDLVEVHSLGAMCDGLYMPRFLSKCLEL